MTMAMGNAADMEKAIETLNEIKESIINAYQKKTGLSRNKISKLMSDETWLNAKKAVELGFADEILFADNNNTKSSDDKPKVDDDVVVDDADAADHSPDAAGDKASEEGISLEGGDGQSVAPKAKGNKNAKDTFWGAEWQPYSTRAMGQAILNRLIPAVRDDAVSDEANSETADTDAVLASSLTATAEETPQEVQTQEEEAPSATTETTNSEANTEASTVSDVSKVSSNSDTSAEPDAVTDNTTNAEEGQTECVQPEEIAQTELTEPTASSDNAQDNVADTVSNTLADTVATGDEQELGAEDSEPVDAATTNTATNTEVTNDLPDDVKVPEEPKSITDEAKDTSKSEVRELTIGLDGKAKDGSMPYALLEKQLQLLR